MMDAPFPFGFPLATAVYLTLYVLTLVVHVAFMNYVLAGSGYLAVARLLTRHRTTERAGLIMTILADWLPFALSAAITAGVAPLLFIQILYKHQFYTANLLLFNRWMSILPVLIVGFYLLYLWKSRPAGRWSWYVRAAIGLGAFACFAFTAYSWTENHVLGMRGMDVWAGFYASDALRFRDPEILPRLTVWFVGAFPTMTLLVAWQVWYKHRRGEEGDAPFSPTKTAAGAIAGVILAGAGAGWYYSTLAAPAREACFAPVAAIYLYAAIAGAGLQLGAWAWQLRRPALETTGLVVASAGLVVSIVGATVVREAIRLSRIDVAGLYDMHAAAWEKGGLLVFLLFAGMSAAAIAWCTLMVRRQLRRGPV